MKKLIKQTWIRWIIIHGFIQLFFNVMKNQIKIINQVWIWLLTSIVFAVSIIQLPSRKGAQYGINVPHCYLKKPQYYLSKNLIKIFFGLSEKSISKTLT